MNGRRNKPGTSNASDSEVERNFRIVSAAKRLYGGEEIPLQILDRLIPPVPCRRTRLRLEAAAEGRPFIQSTRGKR